MDKTITIRQVAPEPNMAETLGWLDEHVNDGRIVAAILEIQAEKPAANVILVTGDLNHQTKSGSGDDPLR